MKYLKKDISASLRRHYPVQVIRDRDISIPISASSAPSNSINLYADITADALIIHDIQAK